MKQLKHMTKQLELTLEKVLSTEDLTEPFFGFCKVFGDEPLKKMGFKKSGFCAGVVSPKITLSPIRFAILVVNSVGLAIIAPLLLSIINISEFYT